jgi:ribokinase
MIVTGLGQCSLDYLAVVESYPDVNTKNEVLTWKEQGGGPVATALVALSRLGISCRFYGVLGDDYAGTQIARSLADEHIDIKGLVKRKEMSSQTAFIVIDKKTAKRTIFWKRPAGAALHAEELGNDFLAGSDILLLDGLMKEASLFAASQARQLSIPVMLDAGRMRPGMLDIARMTDYVVASEDFAKDLGWKLLPEALRKEKDNLGIPVLTITLDERGSITIMGDQTIEVPAFPVQAVDTTGAGDVFHGGYLYGILRNWDLKNTIVFASAMAAMKCTRIGGRSGIPQLKEVLHFLDERGFGFTP